MHSITPKFVDRYLDENDFRFVQRDIKIQPEFSTNVDGIVTYILDYNSSTNRQASIPGDILVSIGSGVLSNLVYDYLKKRYQAWRIERSKQDIVKPIRMIGQNRDKTILDFGETRPFFKVGAGAVIILENLTIRYSGKSEHFFEIETVPSIILSNVRFTKKDK